MRDLYSWKQKLLLSLRSWPVDANLRPEALCDVELGLSFLCEVAPGECAQALCVFLSGYPFRVEGCDAALWDHSQRIAWGNVRHLLSPFKSRSLWRRRMESYRALPEHLRGFVVDENGVFARKAVSVGPQRHQIYAQTLERPLNHGGKPVRWADASEYEFINKGRFESVRIPPELVLEPPQNHNFKVAPQRRALQLSWDDLQATAEWMDEEERRRALPISALGRWKQRFDRVRLEVRQEAEAESQLVGARTLSLDGLVHLIGMVSSGKSTLMDVVAVWAARRGLKVTLVVGDVVGALNRAQLFERLGLGVGPVLGEWSRRRHLARLHQTLAGAGSATAATLPQLEHAGFRWLSTACPLDGLRGENNLASAKRPLELGQQPCLTLHPRKANEDSLPNARANFNENRACPLYSGCPLHRGQRDLVEASIWIATPASLIYTRVAPQLNPQRVRFAEMVYRRSDLIIVDEADQVQVQLDTMFNPSQTLVGQDGWLNSLSQQVTEQLNLKNRAPLAEEGVSVWLQNHSVAQNATDRLYQMLLTQPDLRRWMAADNYFTSLTLFERLAQSLAGEKAAPEVHSRLMEEFNRFIYDPIGEENNQELCQLAHLVLLSTQPGGVRDRLRSWIQKHQSPRLILTGDAMSRQIKRLEIALVVAVLQNRVHHLIQHWSYAEVPLGLEGGNSRLSHHPPEDYQALLPSPPMGQVLAFQYVCDSDDSTGKPGELRFFHCLGVGRWMLLHLHELFAGDGIAGPNVLLLSGTSWAGTSPSYHLQTPVSGVLRAPDAEVEAIRGSRFTFWPQRDETGTPIRVSGASEDGRAHALNALLTQLARPNGFGGKSLLEQKRDTLPPGRQRVLLLVNSYEQTREAYASLLRQRPDWSGQMRYLVPDDAHFEGDWRGDEATLRRGAVSELAGTGAWLLIAPLLAVERGHNILTAEGDRAAIGAVFFLVRPHPRPDDINFAVHSINRWAVERHNDTQWLEDLRLDKGNVSDPLSWNETGELFRTAAYRRWHGLLRLPMTLSTLPDAERDAMVWSQLVSIWQVIGRLVRGGSPARVFFCDAAFAPNAAAVLEERDTPSSSLLIAMHEVLRPYFEAPTSHSDSALVQTLYSPFYEALSNISGLNMEPSLDNQEIEPLETEPFEIDTEDE